MQVYGLVSRTEEGIWTEAKLRSIYPPRSDWPVRKLAYDPKSYVLFVILYRIYVLLFSLPLFYISESNFIVHNWSSFFSISFLNFYLFMLFL